MAANVQQNSWCNGPVKVLASNQSPDPYYAIFRGSMYKYLHRFPIKNREKIQECAKNESQRILFVQTDMKLTSLYTNRHTVCCMNYTLDVCLYRIKNYFYMQEK